MAYSDDHQDSHTPSSGHSPEPLFGRWQVALLIAMICSTPLVATWSRPFGPFKLAELFGALLVASVILSKRKVSLDLTPAGEYFLGYLLVSVISFASFYLFAPTSLWASVPWASGVRRPPIYNGLKISQQLLFITVFILLANIRRRLTVLLLVRLYILAATAAALLGITEFIGYFAFGSHFGLSLWYVPRVASTFPEPGPFGSYLLTAIIPLLVLLLHRNELVFSRRTLKALLGIQLLAEFLTFSGRGWVAFVIVLGLLLFTMANLRQRLLALGLALVTFVTVVSIPELATPVFYIFTTKLRVYLTASKYAATSGGRIAGLYIAPYMFSKHPIIGIGTGNYPVLRNQIKPAWVPTVSFLDLPANHYLQILAQNGILGFIVFFYGGSCLLRSLWFGRNRVDTDTRPVLIGLVFAWYSMLIALMVSSVLWFAHFWIPLGLAYALLQTGSTDG